jgi:outer membrane protein assembly factor BamE (lipoprotein component of BamABCDE complex)
LLAGCITVGMEFNKNAVDLIKPGQTTLEEVRKMFGNPVRTGMDEGKLSWTYLRYRATLGGDFDGQDLVVKFDAQNKVTSFSYHSTDTGREIKR